MKSFWEKLKDMLYDGVDYIIMIAIVVGVILIINWRLDGLFAESNTETSPKPSETITENKSNHDDSTDSKEAEESNDSKPSDDEKKDEAKDKNSSDTKKEDEAKNSNSSDTEDKKESNIIIEVDIPAGSASSNIGDILVSKGLIKEKGEFLKKLTESNLETKLRHGKYKIPENSSLEEILNILTK